jgi:subtilisin-like proprotein convertase family protein
MKKLRNKISMFLCLTLLLVTTMTASAASDSYEPNNSLETAAQANIPMRYEPIRSTISSSNDVDWFKEKYNYNGFVTVQLTSPAGQAYELRVLYKETETAYSQVRVIAESTDRGKNVRVLKFPVTEGRYYYFLVNSLNGYSNSEYELKQISFESTYAAAYENNNTTKDAYDIDLFEDNVSACIDSCNDVDYYKFYSEYTGKMTISLISPSNKNYDLFILNRETGRVVGQSNVKEGCDDATFDSIKGGQYTVIVYGATDSDYYYRVPYTLFKSNLE